MKDAFTQTVQVSLEIKDACTQPKMACTQLKLALNSYRHPLFQRIPVHCSVCNTKEVRKNSSKIWLMWHFKLAFCPTSGVYFEIESLHPPEI